MNYTQQIKQYIGGKYTAKISCYLISKNVKKSNGELYSSEYIQSIARGVNENEDIEDAILKLIQQAKIKKEKRQRLLTQLNVTANLFKD